MGKTKKPFKISDELKDNAFSDKKYMKLKIFIAFLLGFLVAVALLLSRWVTVETNNKLIITQKAFSENCRDICYYYVYGEVPEGCYERTD